jgi:Sec-independent protein translocase protein TatA
MGFATEILFILVLGWLVLGAKQLQIVLRHVARARNKFEEASHGFRSLLTAELGAAPRDDKTDPMHELRENQ